MGGLLLIAASLLVVVIDGPAWIVAGTLAASIAVLAPTFVIFLQAARPPRE